MTQVCKAAGVIFIDEATEAPFMDESIPDSIILNNPFHMAGVAAYKDYRPDSGKLDTAQHTVFSSDWRDLRTKGDGIHCRYIPSLQEP